MKQENKKLYYEYLTILGKGYETGDFSELFPLLSEDCVFESQWVLYPNVGYEVIVDYLTGKGRTLKRTQSFPSCSVQELVGNINYIRNANFTVNGEKQKGAFGLYYDDGELCLLMHQILNGETNDVIVRLKVDEENKIKRIDLCMPELFRFKPYKNE